jgi:hypothetical protein
LTTYRSAPLQTRHRLVYEIGDEGVARLCASEAALSLSGAAGAWAEEYLRRAGMSVVRTAEASEHDSLGGAEAALRGAFEAVEIIKRTLGLGTPGNAEEALREASPEE